MRSQFDEALSSTRIAAPCPQRRGGDGVHRAGLVVIADTAEQIVHDARRATAAPGDFMRARRVNFHVEQICRAGDDFVQVAAQ